MSMSYDDPSQHDSPNEPQYRAEPPIERDFEDLTLAEALSQLWRRPITTFRALKAVAQTPDYSRQRAGSPSVFARPAYQSPLRVLSSPDTAPVAVIPQDDLFPRSPLLVLAQWLTRLLALALAVVGGLVMFVNPLRSEETGLNAGAPYLIAGFLVWLLSELFPALFNQPRDLDLEDEPVAQEATLTFSSSRLFAAGAGLATSIMAWLFNGGNMFTPAGVIEWGLSIFFWVWAVAPEGWTPLVAIQTSWRWLTSTRIYANRTLLALVAIMLLGALFRFQDINNTPPEMTSDHVEKLLDVNRILNGQTNVFFANNDGRDALHFYGLALLSQVPGMHLDFYLLKLMNVLEGLITIPILWWMGREVIGKQERRLGNIVGLCMAGLVAASYWHEMLSRLGLRIVLTPLFTALVIIFLVRAVRYNRRADFIWCGLALGVSLYAYQSMRMMPLAVLIVVGIAFVFGLKTWAARRHMFVNFVALVLVTFAIFVPLFRFAYDYPEDFLRRTSGRLFGEEISRATNDDGTVILRTPTLDERVDAFAQNLPVLVNNFRNALLMYNWKGDVAWINNAPNAPALDPLSGGLLIVGLGAWFARMVRRRDAFDWAFIPLILVMVLPSALSIAYPIENPSASRISGTLPGIYLLAALPLALIALALPRLIGKLGVVLAVFGVAVVFLVSYDNNAVTYLDDYHDSYALNSLPYSVGGRVLKDFAQANGYGNAFIIAYPYWWDHRALAIESGRIDWSNTIPTLDDAPKFLQNASQRFDDLRLDISQDMLFFYSVDDLSARRWLETNFPTGQTETVTTYQPTHPFNLYRVPAPGQEAFSRFLISYGLEGEVG